MVKKWLLIMNYKLHNIPITELGCIPVKRNQAYALHGMFDLPRRVGKTEHDWGTSIEPFVDEGDILLDGRLLTLNVAIREDRLEEFKQSCVECTLLGTDFDEYKVVCRDEIAVKQVGKYCIVEIKFWQNEYVLSDLLVLPSNSGTYRLDNFNLSKDFGIYVSQSNNMSNKAKRIEIATTEFYERANYRGSRDITLNCKMYNHSADVVYNNMKNLHSVMMSPGIKTLTTPNKSLSVYFKNGLTAIAVKQNIIQFNLIATTA